MRLKRTRLSHQVFLTFTLFFLMAASFFPFLGVSGLQNNSYQIVSTNGTVNYSPPPEPPPSAYPFWSADSYWHMKIPEGAPSDPDSDEMISWLLNRVGGLGSCNFKAWTPPIWDATEDTPTHTVYKSNKVSVWYYNVPIPDEAHPAIDADHGFSVIDWPNRYFYDFWNFWYEDGIYWAGDGWRTDLDSDGLVYPPAGGDGVGGSNIPAIATHIRDEDIKAGVINHPLACCMSGCKKDAYVFPPASRTDGSGTDAYAIPHGCRIQLNPSIDLDSLGLSDTGKIIAKAMQEYGIVVSEGGSGWHVYAEHEYSIEGGDWDNFGLTYSTLSPIPDEAWAWRIVDYSVFGAKVYSG